MRVYRKEYTPVTETALSIVNIVFSIIETLIGLRIILELLGASRVAGFVRFVYGISLPFISPFIGIFPSRVVEDGFFLDSAAIFAFVIYAILWALISSIIRRFGIITENEE